MEKVNLALLASGNGSNVENILRYFERNSTINVSMVVTNNSKAGVIQRVEKYHIPIYVIDNDALAEGIVLQNLLAEYKVDYVILAGFLRKVPQVVTMNYPNRILNIHPSLLPKYGGKGMYGMNVHQSVIQNGEKESGITIHLVNENYDEGKVIDQFRLNVQPHFTPEDLQKAIQQLEKKFFPLTIEKFIKSN